MTIKEFKDKFLNIKDQVGKQLLKNTKRKRRDGSKYDAIREYGILMVKIDDLSRILEENDINNVESSILDKISKIFLTNEDDESFINKLLDLLDCLPQSAHSFDDLDQALSLYIKTE